MASITFETQDNIVLGGSGLGFYGSSFGASVATTSYQDTTYVTNDTGQDDGGAARNVKYLSATGCYLGFAAETGKLVEVNGVHSTLMIHFNHDSAVKVQNVQLRIFDRDNINNPATGVITKVAEIVNFNNKTYANWGSVAGDAIVSPDYGYGDAFWWGSPWPSGGMYAGQDSNLRPSYTNSVGVVFPNYTDYQYNKGSGNPDQRVSGISAPAFDTVGGTGIIVPLLDSPGSGGRYLASGILAGDIKPKFIQYANTTYQTNSLGVSVAYSSGIVGNLEDSYGGSGYDTRHTWRVALSAKPLSIGSKTQYGMYVSLEYL